MKLFFGCCSWFIFTQDIFNLGQVFRKGCFLQNESDGFAVAVYDVLKKQNMAIDLNYQPIFSSFEWEMIKI